MSESIFEESISGRDNPTVKRLALLCADRAERYARREFVAEGVKLCGEAAAAGITEMLLATEAAARKYPEELRKIAAGCARRILISESVGEKISGVKSTQGVFCLCKMLDNRDFADKIDSGGVSAAVSPEGRYMLLCSLQDPGNIGTIIRCCDAFGVTAVVLTRDCPDIYSPKLLRSTMGSLFHIPVLIAGEPAEAVDSFRRAGIKLYAAALTDDSVPLGEARFRDGCAVVIGNEGRGLEREIIGRCDCTVKIEMRGRAESLNAASAASVLAYRLTQD